jgi:hypothetical protein
MKTLLAFLFLSTAAPAPAPAPAPAVPVHPASIYLPFTVIIQAYGVCKARGRELKAIDCEIQTGLCQAVCTLMEVKKVIPKSAPKANGTKISAEGGPT